MKNSFNRSSVPCQGFTVLELMVVIAVIAILSALALPSYQSGIIRKQIEEAWPLSEIAKTPIAASWAGLQVLPADNTAAGLPAADKIVNNYVNSVSVQDGAINITFGNRAHSSISGKIITLRPAVVSDAPIVPVTWVCGKAEAPTKMTLMGSDKTTVPDMMLPLNCRALTKQPS